MIEGINMMLSGDFRCSHLKTKTFGLVSFEYADEPFITVKDNTKQYRDKIDAITSNAEYDIILKEKEGDRTI